MGRVVIGCGIIKKEAERAGFKKREGKIFLLFTYIYIYIYIWVCVCVCVCKLFADFYAFLYIQSHFTNYNLNRIYQEDHSDGGNKEERYLLGLQSLYQATIDAAAATENHEHKVRL